GVRARLGQGQRVRGLCPCGARPAAGCGEGGRVNDGVLPEVGARFEAIVSGAVDPDDVMRRPHVRFDGERIAEIAGQKWAHAQNDALGYFLWLCSKLGAAGAMTLDEQGARTLALFPAYFRAIRYWQDEDSGHWEEVRKREASSIGTVVAGL